ncbi:MAG TPA: glycosyltransferase family 39 protein [Acidimicrobiia bacterium]|jgi:4-amino-4-deoxy-L-arabinose transferase-like glycosyltransferase
MPAAGVTGLETADAPPVSSSRVAHWRTDALVLAIATIVIRIPAFFAEKSLVFDDGVFASSARAMRNGELPFRDIFSSQGPVFLPLVWIADLVGFRTMDAPRLLSVAAGVLLTVAVYSCARHVTTRGNALLAAGLVTTSGSVLWVTVPVNADGPALALSVLAVAFALRYREEPRLRTAVWMGLAAGGAVSIKALSVPALVIAGLVVLLSSRHTKAGLRTGVRDAAVAGGIAVGVYVVTALPFGIADVWDQSYSYHQNSRRVATHEGAFRKVLDTLWDRDKLVVVALALALITWLVRFIVRRREGRLAKGSGDRAMTVVVAFLVLWVVMVVGLLVWEPAMWRAHVVHLVPPLALLAALKPPPWKVLLVAGVLTVPFAIASNTSILWPGGYTGQQAALERHLETFPSDAQFISDEPGLVWRSGHDTPGNFADTSYQRLDDGSITQRSLVKAASAEDVCGVIVTSPVHFGRLGGLPDALALHDYHPVEFGDTITLYERDTPFCT